MDHPSQIAFQILMENRGCTKISQSLYSLKLLSSKVILILFLVKVFADGSGTDYHVDPLVDN